MTTTATTLEHRILELINQSRAAERLSPLTMELNLNTSADRHSEWMSDALVFSHTGVRGSSATDRMMAAGTDLRSGWGTAENIAANSSYSSENDRMEEQARTLHQQFMNSPPHRANILTPEFTHVGIGVTYGPMSYSGTVLRSVVITQNFAYSGGIMDGDHMGSAGGDRLIAAAGDDMLHGLAGQDTLTGNRGADTLDGGAGNDQLNGNQHNDQLHGGDGFDTIDAGEGNDTVYGGNGRDRAMLGSGNDLFKDNGQGGDLGRDTVFAGAGNDTIEGGNGNDEFHGLVGNDLIYGRLGHDRIFGGDGYDTIESGNGNDTVNGGNGRDRILLGKGDDLFNDNSQGGVRGCDTVFGGAGNDTIQGGNGDDIFRGELGDDQIFARLGNDTVIGGAGNDTMGGGGGADTFVFGPGFGSDRINGYEKGTDKLEFDDALWSGTLSAAQVVGRFATDTGPDIRFDFGNGNTVLLAGVGDLSGLADDLIIT